MTILLEFIKELFRTQLDSSEKREMFTGAGVTFVVKLTGMILSYITWFVIARIYGASVMGGFALAMAVFSMFTLIGAMGAGQAIIRFITETITITHDKCKFGRTYIKLGTFFLFLSLFMSISLFISSSFIANHIIQKPELSLAFKMMSLAIPLAAITATNISVLRALKRMWEMSLLAFIVPVVINLIMIYIFAFALGIKVESLVWAHIVSLAVSLVIGIWILMRRGGFNCRHVSDPQLTFSRILSISGPMFFSTGMIVVFGLVDIIILGRYYDSDVVGVYRTAFKVSTLGAFCLNAVGSIAAAQFSTAFSERNTVMLKKLTEHSARLVFWTTLPIAGGIFIFAKPIMGAFGKEFVSGAFCLRILIMAQLFNAVSGLTGEFMNVCDGHKTFRNIIMVAAIINVILNIFLIPHYGIVGAAVATLCGVIFSNVVSLLTIAKRFGFWIGFKFGL